MRRTITDGRGVVLALLLSAAFAPNAHARPSQQVPVGIRALALGGAYTALSDDVSALFWNPAGLPWIGHEEIAATHADLYGTNLKDNLASFALPLSPRTAVAVDWYHSGFDDLELDFGETRIDFAYGKRIFPFLSAGATVKYLSRATNLDGVSVRRGRGVGFDLGLLATPLDKLRVGVIGQDMFDTNITYSEGLGTTPAFPMNFRVAAAYAVMPRATVAADVDDRWHVGVEGRPLDILAVRAGLQDDWSNSVGATWSAGLGIKAGIFRFDYARVEHPTLGATNHFGLAMEFSFNPSQVRIESIEPKPLFASFYKSYADEPVALVRLTNLKDADLDVTVSLQVPEYMNKPIEKLVILPKKSTTDVPVSAVFPDELARLPENRHVNMRVTAAYQSARTPRTEKFSSQGTIYAAGAIDWSQGVEQAAGFVTESDPVIASFARAATRTAALMEPGVRVQRNIAFAAAIVDALASLGFAYVPDPTHPYKGIAAKGGGFDTIAYPRTTLKTLTGDCDDTSVLLAALLENVGIATRFVDVPGHIFLMMDTGVHGRNRVGLGFDEGRTVVAADRVWIPLETVSIGKGFARAWSDGAEAFAAYAARGRLNQVDVHEAAERFVPAIPDHLPAPTPNLDENAIRTRVASDLDSVRTWRDAHLSRLRATYERTLGEVRPRNEGALEVARLYFSAGNVADAARVLQEAQAAEPENLAVIANLGTLEAARGDLKAAAALYERVLTTNKTDPGVWLNLGLVRHVMGDSLGAASPLAEGMTRSGGFDQACALLGIAPQPSEARGAPVDVGEAEVRALLQAARRPAGSATPRGSRAEPASILYHLYWKER